MKILKKQNSNECSNIYRHLFSLLKEEDLEWQLNYMFELSEGKDEYFKEYEKTDWFTIFHKSIRQTDFFNDCCFRMVKHPLLTDLEEKEFRFLNKKVREDGYIKKDEKGNFTDEYSRFLDLHKRRERQELKESIDGKLDSILWNMIYIDNNVLYNTFLRVFSEYKLQQDQK